MTDTAQPTEGQEPLRPILETAFLCYMNTEGHWMATPEVHVGGELQISRQATPDDLYMGVCMVKKDLECFEIASRTVQLQQQATQATINALAERKAAEQIRSAAGLGDNSGVIDLSQLRPT